MMISVKLVVNLYCKLFFLIDLINRLVENLLTN